MATCGHEGIFGQVCQLPAGHAGMHAERSIFVNPFPFDASQSVPLHLDELGRLKYSPAIGNLLVVARWILEPQVDSLDDVRPELDAVLRQVDAEAKALGAIATESSDFGPIPNKVAVEPSDVVQETRNPAITPGSGAERDCSPLPPAVPEVEERRCKK